MVALRAWYDSNNKDEPVIVATIADVDALLDRMSADRPSMRLPPLMQLSRRDADGWGVLHIGVDTDTGIVTHTDATGSFVTTNRTTVASGQLTYDYMATCGKSPATRRYR